MIAITMTAGDREQQDAEDLGVGRVGGHRDRRPARDRGQPRGKRQRDDGGCQRDGRHAGAEPLHGERPDQIDRHEQAKDPERAIACRQRLAAGLVEVAGQLVAVLDPEAGGAERQRRAIQPSVE